MAGNAGVALRRASKQYNLEIGNAFTYALGAEAPFRLAGQRLAAVASLGGEDGASTAQAYARNRRAEVREVREVRERVNAAVVSTAPMP